MGISNQLMYNRKMLAEKDKTSAEQSKEGRRVITVSRYGSIYRAHRNLE